VIKVGEIFETILKEVLKLLSEKLDVPTVFIVYIKSGIFFPMGQTVKLRDEHRNDMCLSEAISIVVDRYPHLRYTIYNTSSFIQNVL
jgi:hypothetical protein